MLEVGAKIMLPLLFFGGVLAPFSLLPGVEALSCTTFIPSCRSLPSSPVGQTRIQTTQSNRVVALFHNNGRKETSFVVATKMSSDWSSFQALEDDDDLLYDKDIDRNEYATEDDSPEFKASVGSALEGPSIERPAPPINVPPGSQLELSEEVVLGVLSGCREELGTLFGYSAENRGVGITGGVDYVDMDGPTIILRLKGRFWHERTTVLQRVGNYLQQRIPEIIDVVVEDPYQLTDEANEEW